MSIMQSIRPGENETSGATASFCFYSKKLRLLPEKVFWQILVRMTSCLLPEKESLWTELGNQDSLVLLLISWLLNLYHIVKDFWFFILFCYRNIKDHAGILRWYSPKSGTDMKKWEKALPRGGDFKMTMTTKICSNHFTAGYCSDICWVPTLYLRGYESSHINLKAFSSETETEPFPCIYTAQENNKEC